MTPPTTQPDLAKMYKPAEVEPAISDRWRDTGAFHAEPDAGGTPYCIVIPPPNVTAALHMGHALNNTLQDILVRWHRMLGDNTLWMPGTDHAGIATQTVVEKRVLQEEGKRRTDFTRDQFVAKIQAWKDQYEQRITDQLKVMGCSCDWDRQRFTMDDVCARAVREAFFRLFKDGLIYRGKRLVNWDPVTQTALADDEVEMQEVDGHFWYLRYPLTEPVEVNGQLLEHVTVATTRPETMLGDTAVAVNPKDPRAAALVGKSVCLPIVGRVIPIVADDYVVLSVEHGGDEDDAKAKFATGFLKVTPAHDPNDWDIGLRHDLPVVNVLAPDATISKDHGWTDVGPAAFLLGMDRFEAREAVVHWFRENELLEEVKPYRHSVGHSYRSHVPIEPYLSDQWYVQVTDERLAGAALRAMAPEQRAQAEEAHGFQSVGVKSVGVKSVGVKSVGAASVGVKSAGADTDASWHGQLRFIPDRYARTFQHWHENIRDWCISRQLWWGHRIPVWTITFSHARYGGYGPKEHRQRCEKALADLFAHCALSHDVITQSASEKIEGTIPIHVCSRSGRADKALDLLSKILSHKQGATGHLLQEYKAHNDEFRLEFGKRAFSHANSVVRQVVKTVSQDPDVLDTWFSSALWPISTMGWPDDTPELGTWNPSSALCTAREIITLWVSRMVMFNLYFRGCLPFTDVFIHAMIQDGHGQKMSKSLGNGVDPVDIIHSHGSDAMRFTLALMTTQTQDVRMPVDVVCPHTGETFTPKFITTASGHRVAGPIQDCPSDPKKKMVTSFGLSSGQAKPTDQMPLARNTSEKFDMGRNFANKLWNAVRFALSKLHEKQAEVHGLQSVGFGGAGGFGGVALADRWILSRLAATIRDATAALEQYQFNPYGQGLYDFIWRDFCDWYVEAIKPTVESDAQQQQVLAATIDVILRLLHPVMPFITEKLWEHLNAMAPQRGLPGLDLPASELLVRARWPRADESLTNDVAERTFATVQAIVGAARETRTTYKVPPRQPVTCAIKSTAQVTAVIDANRALIQTLANLQIAAVGDDTARPANAAAAVVGQTELYLQDLVDPDAERARLGKRLAELDKSIAALTGRLNNKGYTDKAPAHLVQQTRDQVAHARHEKEAIEAQLAALG